MIKVFSDTTYAVTGINSHVIVSDLFQKKIIYIWSDRNELNHILQRFIKFKRNEKYYETVFRKKVQKSN